MAKRKALSKRVRFEVFKRDLFTCCYCGRKPPEVMLECDHVVPVCEGGADTIDNLTTACVACNAGKAGKQLGAVAPILDELAVLASAQELMERAVGLRGQIVAERAERAAEGEALGMIMDEWDFQITDAFQPEESSLRKFIRRMPLGLILEAINTTSLAMNRGVRAPDAPRYFYGVCWSIIKEAEGSE